MVDYWQNMQDTAGDWLKHTNDCDTCKHLLTNEGWCSVANELDKVADDAEQLYWASVTPCCGGKCHEC